MSLGYRTPAGCIKQGRQKLYLFRRICVQIRGTGQNCSVELSVWRSSARRHDVSSGLSVLEEALRGEGVGLRPCTVRSGLWRGSRS